MIDDNRGVIAAQERQARLFAERKLDILNGADFVFPAMAGFKLAMNGMAADVKIHGLVDTQKLEQFFSQIALIRNF